MIDQQETIHPGTINFERLLKGYGTVLLVDSKARHIFIVASLGLKVVDTKSYEEHLGNGTWCMAREALSSIKVKVGI